MWQSLRLVLRGIKPMKVLDLTAYKLGCSAGNRKELAGQPGVDGFLVDGASLKPKFVDIIKSATVKKGDSTRLITASADQTVKLWNIKTGEELCTFPFDSPARSVDFSTGDELAVITTDPFMEKTSTIRVYRIAEDINDRGKH